MSMPRSASPITTSDGFLPRLDPGHHPVFARAGGWAGWVEAGFNVDMLGVMTDVSYFSHFEKSDSHRRRWVEARQPVVDEEYFEWIDLLEAVETAEGRFTMIELGAGYGRWMTRGHVAAKQRGLGATLIGVEAEPTHFEMLQAHLSRNGVPGADVRLVQAAVAGEAGEVSFLTGHASTWFGQAITRRVEPALPDYPEARIVRMRTVTLASLLEDLEFVDLIDLDIQGAELDVLAATTRALDEKVRRIHIATHKPHLEQGLRELFQTLGWACVWDFPGEASHDTPYGAVAFFDGVQTWINPRMGR